MSADLFAEFANNPPPSHQATSSTSPTSRGISQSAAQDPFNFGFGSSHINRSPSPVEKWPSLSAVDPPSGGLPGWASGSTAISKITPNDDDDGWGDFETAETSVPPTSRSLSHASGSLASPSSESKPKVRPFRVPTIDLMTNTLVDVGPAKEEPKPQLKSGRFSYSFSKKKTNRNTSSVLFDADDFELQGGDDAEDDDDDHHEIGAFEAGRKTKPPPRSDSAPLLDLLSLDDPIPQPQQAKPQTQNLNQLFKGFSFGATSPQTATHPKSPSWQQTNSLADLDFKPSSAPAPGAFLPNSANKKQHESSLSDSSISAWPSTERGSKAASKLGDDDDGWGAWDDVPSGTGKQASEETKPSTGKRGSWDWNAPVSEATLKDGDPPPTNVPPPSVILSMFPDLLASGNALFHPISRQPTAVKQKTLSSPETAQFLEAYILLATTAGRVIAGRKQRWHRDKILAKSMSISAAGSKGMKLAGVDKTQAAKEEREVADVVAVWQEHVGRLRSAVMTANTAGRAKKLKVPELRESVAVSTAKMVPTAPKACVICGLKREERVAKVDFEVEDSFGEWWAEHWGHRACKNFWIEHEQRIRQR